MSFKKKNMGLKSSYGFKEILLKWLRFIIPFMPVFLIQFVIQYFIMHKISSWHYPLLLFLTGGIGPGSYYFPVMLQVVLFIPLIYECVRRCGIKGLVCCFTVNFLYEVLKTVFNINPGFYRLCALRYIFILAYGCFLFEDSQRDVSKRKSIWYCIAGVFGVGYIILFNYTTAIPVFTNQWTTTSLFAVLYIVPISYLLIRKKKWSFSVLEELGKASFNIFLIQMLYYAYAAGSLYQMIELPIIRIVINIIICFSFGWIFYRIEIPITQKVIKRIRGNYAGKLV